MMTAAQSQRNSRSDQALTALCTALPLPDAAQDKPAPEWIHLLPTGSFSGADGRGPYHVKDANRLVEASLEAMAGSGVVDENHATDLATPKGEPAPARGWITALEARTDGIWGKVDWTRAGLALLADRAYRHISPVIMHLKDGTVTAILRASLVNKPNLRGLAALNQETPMDFMDRLRAALGLGDEAGEDAVLAGINAAKGGTALQAALNDALGPIARAAGLAEGADAKAVLAGVEQMAKAKTSGDDTTVKALQAELTEVTTKFTALQTSIATDRATAFVDGAIKAGRVGVKPLRDHYIARHAANPAEVEKEINSFPSLGRSGASIEPPPAAKDGQLALNAEQRSVATMLGIDPKDYAETLKAERDAREAMQ
ncbi:Mu-like prophage I protein [Hoeflea phototrophica DFL-43]|uniref:Mu-like prophage I protein n=1 Tax=Hoeflea phototrophica (strain DSM 17068 / NCIMB 14078 / DFL-43) TaxID=411684 RepID=A9D2X1_HOEPD|nr:phage protease [Hoeflea phototrophica]EDQ34290.1 Mu-like prophage I protein [Hoeflea phototrophica DFL-43]